MTIPTTHAIDVALQPGASTLLSALRACVRAAGDGRADAELAGASGLAFFLNIGQRPPSRGGLAYPWQLTLPAVASRLGYGLELVSSDDEDPTFDQAQGRAVAQVVDAAWQGRPSICWGVHAAAFGIVRGFDAARRTLVVSGVRDGAGGPTEIPYEALGRPPAGALLVATLFPLTTPPAPGAVVRAVLAWAVRHLRDRGPRFGGYACGLGAYESWRRAIESGTLDPAEHRTIAALAAELRAYAGPYLRGAAAAVEPREAGPLAEAAEAFDDVAQRLATLAKQPSINPATPDDLDEIATAERRATDALGRLP
jgi:hypothetical protein